MSKIISALMSVLLLLQTAFPALLGAKPPADVPEAPDITSVAEYMNYVQEYGAPALDTATFLKTLKPLRVLRLGLTGRLFSGETDGSTEITLDEDLTRMTDYILENTGLDIAVFLDAMPNFGTPLGALITERLNLDTVAMRHTILGAADKARAEGYNGLSSLLYIFAMFFTVAEKIEIYGVRREENPDEITVLMDVTYRDGNTETVDPDIIVNTKTGHAYNLYGTGLAGSGFEVDIFDLTVYTVANSWQRKFGFGLLYDAISATNPAFNYVTRRFKFDYAGKEWMLQIWKGNYALVTNGGEIGIYNRAPGSRGSFYQAAGDDEMLTFALDVYRGDTLLVSRGPVAHWWLTAFKMSPTLYLPDTLTMHFSVTVKDEEMLDALLAAIDAEAAHDVAYTVEGLTVNGTW